MPAFLSITACCEKNEADQVLSTFRELGIDVYYVDATDRFLEYLSGVESPEQKRKIIGNQFIEVFKDGLAQIGQINFPSARYALS